MEYASVGGIPARGEVEAGSRYPSHTVATEGAESLGPTEYQLLEACLETVWEAEHFPSVRQDNERGTEELRPS